MIGNKLTDIEYKSVTKEVLHFFDTFCEQHGLNYFVAYGTLIGTIRHGGFIPWDDDIDVCMLRDDYDKFIKLFSSVPNNNYYLLTPTSGETSTYYNNFSRLCDRRVLCKIKGTYDVEELGAFIDVFPLDNVPDDIEERQQLYNDVTNAFYDVVYALPFRCYFTLPLKRMIKHLFSIRRIKNLAIGLQNVKKARESIMLRYKNNECNLVCCLFDNGSNDKLIIHKKNIEVLIRHRFEDIYVNIPKNYEVILKTYYGDYMKCPPEEERQSRHHFEPYWRLDYDK